MSKHKKNVKTDYLKKMISRQSQEIQQLKDMISTMEIEDKDKLCQLLDSVYVDFVDIVNSLRERRDTYDKLIAELDSMKQALNKVAFMGKWNIVRLLIK